MVIDWASVTVAALQNLWMGFFNFIPALIGAVVVFVIGWFIAVGVGKLVSEALKRLNFNRMFEKGAWKEALEKAEFKVDAAGFVGMVAQWVLVIVFLLASVEILGLTQFAEFLNSVLAYLPNVIVATFIFVAAVIISELLEKVLRAAVESIKVGYGHLVGVIVKWSIWIFALLAILIQLQVAPSLINTLFTGLVAVIVVSAGLAFGLGGREIAAEVLRDLYKKLKG
ncbi:MAG: hypothetical protein HYT21_01130 [Candidatus Nealsonbacteria bacterium]|nr:hypothetical protein [Candidatus Nealsonbacteria bacterium]